jgi:hypothetical protein
MTQTLQLLLNEIQELPNEIMSDLETGSHRFNNVASEKFNKNYPSLTAQISKIIKLANELEEGL